MELYCIPGLGADERVFQGLQLNAEFRTINWLTPLKKESIENYTRRLAEEYGLFDKNELVLIGVSFGGLVAVELSKILNLKLVILVSSVAEKKEIPRFLRLIGRLGILPLIPLRLFRIPKLIAYYLFRAKNKTLLSKILDDTDLKFAKWALIELATWNNADAPTSLFRIGGSKDLLLPPTQNSFIVPEGGHFMVVDKATEISKLINEKLADIHN